MLVLIGIALGVGVYFVVYSFGSKKNEQGNYNATRTETTINEEPQNEPNDPKEEDTNTTETQEEEQKQNEENSEQKIAEEKKEPQQTEKEISSFSTKIVTKDSSRQKNIGITCNTLNGTIVEPGATFSFCNTVGQATSAKGYEKADIFDANRKKEKRLRWWKLPGKYYFV